MNIKEWTIVVLFLMIVLTVAIGDLAVGETLMLFGWWLLLTYLEYRWGGDTDAGQSK